MKHFYNAPFLDFNALNQIMAEKNLKSYEKLPYIYEKMGGEFYDNEKKIMKGSILALTSIGGFPIELSDDKELMILGQKN